jgi:predicted RNA polymerase sigma factor
MNCCGGRQRDRDPQNSWLRMSEPLGRAVAEAYLYGPQAGLERLAAVPPESVPARYPGWHTVIGELHFRLGRHAAALRAWREALRLTTARADREFLRRRLAACRPDGGEPLESAI